MSTPQPNSQYNVLIGTFNLYKLQTTNNAISSWLTDYLQTISIPTNSPKPDSLEESFVDLGSIDQNETFSTTIFSEFDVIDSTTPKYPTKDTQTTSTSTLHYLPDIIVIGFEEFLNLQKSFLFGDNEYEKLIQLKLLNDINLALNTHQQLDDILKNNHHPIYSFIKVIRYGSNIQYLFLKSNLLNQYDVTIATDFVGVSWLYTGNKGAVATSLIMKNKESENSESIDHRFVFITCHLDAHVHDATARRLQFEEIVQRLYSTLR